MVSLKEGITDLVSFSTKSDLPNEEIVMASMPYDSYSSSNVENNDLPMSDRAPIFQVISRRTLGCWFYTRLVVSFVGTLCGIVLFFFFFFKYVNYYASISGLFSGVLAAGVLHLHMLHLRGRIEDWYSVSSLIALQAFGFVLALVYTVAMAVYLSLAITRHQAYTVDKFSYYPAATFSFLALKWGFALSLEARHYKRYVELVNLTLLSGVRIGPDSDSETVS